MSGLRPPTSPAASALRGFTFTPPTNPQARAEKPKREPKVKVKNDPRHVAAARELRGRWLEQVNSGRFLPGAHAKYDLSRTLAPLASPASILRSDSATTTTALPAPVAA